MKKLFKYLLTFLFLTCFISSPIYAANNLSVGSYYKTVVNDMDIEMKVNENHSYDIVTHESVTFNSPAHGIYRTIAQQGNFYREINGDPVSSFYYARITNVKVESGQPYETDTDGDAYIIKIGDPNKYVSGKVNYTYSYTWDPGDDGITDFDDVYKTFISQYNENPIENLSITINMPKAFDSNEVSFYSGDYSSTTSGFMEYSINGNTIKAYNTKPIYPGEVVTVNIRLPEGYFVGARIGNGLQIPYFIISALVLIICFFVFIIYGKNKKPLQPVEFYPPNDFDSAQVGYIVNNEVNNEEIVSLIFYFAEKGWLAIENRSPNSKAPKLYLRKLSNIPTDRPNFEKIFFKALFRSSDNPSVKSLSNSRIMGEKFLDCELNLRHYFTGQNQLTSGKAYISKVIDVIGIIIISVLFSFNASYLVFRDFVPDISIILIAASFIGPFALTIANQKKLSYSGYLFTAIGAILSMFFLGSHFILIIINTIIVLFIGLMGLNSNRRTDNGNRWLGECLGFKHFIETAELNQLVMLVEENPEYYYNILPYAYALGLTDKWAKNFEGIAIAPPTWYYDPYNSFDFYLTMRMLNHSMIRNMNTIDTRAYRNMGSGGFGGGGFSGGGFAGGGGGGVGGGSW